MGNEERNVNVETSCPSQILTFLNPSVAPKLTGQSLKVEEYRVM